MRAILTNFVPAPEERAEQAAVVSAPEVRPQRRQSLDDLVATCVRDAFGDAATAAQLLQDRVQSNRKAFKELTRPLIADACFKAVSARIKANRPPEDDWSVDEYQAPDTSHRLHALARSILDYRLPGGTLLRDAFVHEVREGAEKLHERAANAGRHARWLDAIAVRLPRHKTVADVLDESTLINLLNSA